MGKLEFHEYEPGSHLFTKGALGIEIWRHPHTEYWCGAGIIYGSLRDDETWLVVLPDQEKFDDMVKLVVQELKSKIAQLSNDLNEVERLLNPPE